MMLFYFFCAVAKRRSVVAQKAIEEAKANEAEADK